MRMMLLMVRKDLLRQLRAPLAMLGVLGFPLVFSGLIALTFGTGRADLPRVQLLIEDRDGNWVTGLLKSAFKSEQVARYVDVREVGEEGRELMERGEASALLRIPDGFAAAVLEGRPTTLELVRNPAQGILPEIAEQGLTIFAELLSSASQTLRDPLDRLSPYLQSGAPAPTAPDVAEIASSVHQAFSRSERLILPPIITLEASRESDDTEDRSDAPISSVFLFVFPGVAVWALFMVGDMAMRDILTESRQGTLTRQLAAPLRPSRIILGKAVSTAILSLLSLLLLSVIGWAVTGGEVDLAGFALLSMAIVTMVVGYAAVVYGAARNERQGSTLSSILLLVFAFIGGSFVQVDSLPQAVQRFSPFTPFYWGTTGFNSLLRDGGGPADVLLNVGVLAGGGALLLLAGSALLGRKVRKGAAA